jgi:hypothetical protein
MYLMIRLSVNDFFVQHPEIPTRKDFSHRVFPVTRLTHEKTSYQIKSQEPF